MRNSSSKLPYLALGVGILALGFSALFARWANAPGPVTAFYRISIATIIISPSYLRRRLGRQQLKGKALLFALLGGLLAALDHTFFNMAASTTTAANAALLGNTAPLWVALCAWLVFREKLNSKFWIGLAVALAGTTVVMGNDFINHPTLGLGDVFGLVSGLLYGAYYLIGQQGRQRLDTLTYSWVGGIASSVTLVIMCLLFQLPLTGYPTSSVLAFLGAALISHLFGTYSVAYALGHLPASVVSPTMLGQPVSTAILGFFLLGENLHALQIVGGIVVLCGIYLVNVSQQEVRAKKPPLETRIDAV